MLTVLGYTTEMQQWVGAVDFGRMRQARMALGRRHGACEIVSIVTGATIPV